MQNRANNGQNTRILAQNALLLRKMRKDSAYIGITAPKALGAYIGPMLAKQGL